MKKDKFILIAVIVLIVLNLISWGLFWKLSLDRQMPPPHQEEPGIFRSERFLSRQLNFSEKQEQRLIEMQKHHFHEMNQLQQQHHALRKTYVTMAMSPNYDQQDADSLFTEMAKINGEMQKNTWLHFRNIYQLCDKDQKKEFRRLMLRLNKLENRRKHPPLSKPY